jgi:hypothetical protein
MCKTDTTTAPVQKSVDTSDLNHSSGVHFYNPRSTGVAAKRDVVFYDPVQSFIKDVEEDSQKGYTFVPFIGAGFSVTAGIPMIRHLLVYLQRCICMVLGIDVNTDMPDLSTEKRVIAFRAQLTDSIGSTPRWNPRTDSWPPFIDRSRATLPNHWTELVRLVCEEVRSRNVSKHYWIYDHALGTMQEWRTALEFLSHVQLLGSRTSAPTQEGPIQFCDPDRSIVDACFREVMRNKRPSLNHHMLAALSSVLGIDLILTTNFDNLTEMAFDASRIRLTAFDVHMGESLPDISSVSRNRSIIKLHGSLRSLRADFSLEASPTSEDRKTFRNYLAARPDLSRSSEFSSSPKPAPAARHLIMLGVAAREKRTVEFILDALAALKDLKVYWICFSDTEEDTVLRTFSGVTPLRESDGTVVPRVRVLRHTNAGLLFLQLYQVCRKSLPVSGSIFPSTTRLALPPLPWFVGEFEKQSGYDDFLKKFGRRVCGKSSPEKVYGTYRKDHRLVIVDAKAETYGLDSSAAHIFRTLETTHNCLWLDMNDIYNADDLFEAFRESAFHKLNEDDWTPLFRTAEAPGEKNTALVEEIRRIINSSNQPWVLFLDARETPGSNRLRFDRWKQPNGWMDLPAGPHAGASSNASSAEAFRNLMEAFVRAGDDPKGNRIVVCLLCFHKSRGKSYLLETLAAGKWSEKKRPQGKGAKREEPYVHLTLATHGKPPITTKSVLENVILWASGKHLDYPCDDVKEIAARRHFVQALVCIQRPRHIAIAWAKCVNNEWEVVSKFDTKRTQWLEVLEKFHLARRMDGGFLWFKASIRQALRDVLSLTPEQIERANATGPKVKHAERQVNQKTRTCLKHWNARGTLAAVHLGISTWYRTVLDATGVASAVFEIVDHLCWSAEALIRFESLDEHGAKIDPSAAARMATQRVATARQLLTQHFFLIQAQGYPGATLRRLQFIRDFWVRDGKSRTAGQEGIFDLKTITEIIRDKAGIDESTMARLRSGGDFDSQVPGEWAELLRSIAMLQRMADEVARTVNREIADDVESFVNHREAGLRMVRGVPLTQSEVHTELTTPDKHVFTEIAKIWSQPGTSWISERDKHYEWIRWWKWSAMLGNASRSFPSASVSVQRSLAVASLPLEKAIEHVGDDSVEAFILQKPNVAFLGLPESVSTGVLRTRLESQLETLSCFSVATFNLTLRAHTLRRACALGIYAPKTLKDDAFSLEEAALLCATKGLEFAERVQNTGEKLTASRLDAHELKARLLMLAAVASLSREDRDESHRNALAFLGDAEACLEFMSPDRARADLALIELRRAETCLHHASRQSFGTPGAGFEDFTYSLLTNADQASARQEAMLRADNKNELQAKDRAALRIVHARSRDALRFLDRAQPILRERRRNVFWSTWYFERRLRAISLLLWAAVMEPDGLASIPYLGLEAAMYGTETEPDRLLEDALRMIRVDSYRAAMVSLTYASCAFALYIWIRQAEAGGKPTHLRERLGRMCTLLHLAQDEIKAASRSRDPQNLARRQLPAWSMEYAQLDPIALEVIRESQDRIQFVINTIQAFTSSIARVATS